MNSNKRIKKMVYALFMLFALMITTNVYADTPHNLNLKMVKCDSNKYNNLLIILDDIISHILSDTASNLKERKQIFVNINSKKY